MRAATTARPPKKMYTWPRRCRERRASMPASGVTEMSCVWGGGELRVWGAALDVTCVADGSSQAVCAFDCLRFDVNIETGKPVVCTGKQHCDHVHCTARSTRPDPTCISLYVESSIRDRAFEPVRRAV